MDIQSRASAATRLLWLLLVFLAPLSAFAGYDLSRGDDNDLTSFVSRPEIKVPKFNVTVYAPEKVTPGYWFVAPYQSIQQKPQAPGYYQSCQTGPAIYDGSGELVWSGACKFRNQNTCDLRVFRANGTDFLSAIMVSGPDDPKGRGVVLSNTYEQTHQINISRILKSINMHELQVLPEGKTALYIIHRSTWVDLAPIEEYGIYQEAGWILECGFREVELETGNVLFEWWSLDHVAIDESSVGISEMIEGPPPKGWNYFHMNSVDKNADGDYMISARFTDTIYKISGKDGSVIWRLGGDNSNFVLENFNFSKQHDARFIDETDGTTIISFLDNASDDHNKTSDTSSGLLVALDTSSNPMVARVIRRWDRPDGGISHLRGNFQVLPNRNIFAGWSENSYISEHTYEGETIMTAQWVSHRFVTYRAWKYNFTSTPYFPPTMVVQAYGVDPSSSTTVAYVSWNGATEVASWELFRNSSTEPVIHVPKSGFETMIQLRGFEASLYARALSVNGEVLGETVLCITEKPRTWPQDLEIHPSPSENETEHSGLSAPLNDESVAQSLHTPRESLGAIEESMLFGFDTIPTKSIPLTDREDSAWI